MTVNYKQFTQKIKSNFFFHWRIKMSATNRPKLLLKRCWSPSTVHSISKSGKNWGQKPDLIHWNFCSDGDLLPVPVQDASDESNGQNGMNCSAPRCTAKCCSPRNVSEHWVNLAAQVFLLVVEAVSRNRYHSSQFHHCISRLIPGLSTFESKWLYHQPKHDCTSYLQILLQPCHM